MIVDVKTKGILTVSDGLISITDPCYSKDTWCRINDLKIKAGNYKCLYGQCVSGELGDKGRIFELEIIHENYVDALPSLTYEDGSIRAEGERMKDFTTEKIGSIGVDAGLAGFFVRKDDFAKNEDWFKFCNEMGDKRVMLHNGPRKKWQGFFSSSGYGDGCYDVMAHKNKNGEIISLCLQF